MTLTDVFIVFHMSIYVETRGRVNLFESGNSRLAGQRSQSREAFESESCAECIKTLAEQAFADGVEPEVGQCVEPCRWRERDGGAFLFS